MADEIRVAICASQFEVPVLGRQPGVEHFRDGDATISENQRAWCLLAAVTGVALDADAEEVFFRHVTSREQHSGAGCGRRSSACRKSLAVRRESFSNAPQPHAPSTSAVCPYAFAMASTR